MIVRYGKSVADIRKSKKSFFDDNDMLVDEYNKYAEKYKKQPKRIYCKNCGHSLDEGIKYESHGLTYAICNTCGHVQGMYEETDEYSEYIYNDSQYGTYMYARDDEQLKYDERVNNIYLPKAKFLKDVLVNELGTISTIDVLDIGAGSGYFLSALDDLNIKAQGVDMSEHQVAYGNTYMHSEHGTTLKNISGCDIESVIESTDANIISAIGVIEHLTDYHKVLKKIHDNKSVKYFYMMVPMFGLSNVLETITPEVYNRHLGGPHTHVFSTESIEWLCNQYNMEMIGKWQFGTDMMDLYRMCIVKNNHEYGSVIHEKLYKCLDEMQLVLDKNDFCSEIHAVFKFIDK